jgi:hypothetical protein
MALHEVLRSKAGQTLSGILPALAYPNGQALKIGSRDAGTGAITFVLAEGKCDGFMTRASALSTSGRTTTDGNPRTDTEILYDQLLESPFLAGNEGSVERAEALELEGVGHIMTSGTGSIGTGTSTGSKLSFTAGRIRVAQTGDIAQFELVAQLTPEVVGDVRISVEEIPGYLVP